MAKCEVISVDNFIKDIDARSKDFEKMAGAAIYQGAAILADQLRANIEALPERPRSSKKGEMVKGVTKQQKQALLDHMGISKMQNVDGTYDIKIGFEGYDDDKTKSYPNGHPISMIARSVESGTSFLQKTPFIRPASQKAKGPAEEAMKKEIETQWQTEK